MLGCLASLGAWAASRPPEIAGSPRLGCRKFPADSAQSISPLHVEGCFRNKPKHPGWATCFRLFGRLRLAQPCRRGSDRGVRGLAACCREDHCSAVGPQRSSSTSMAAWPARPRLPALAWTSYPGDAAAWPLPCSGTPTNRFSAPSDRASPPRIPRCSHHK